MDRRRKKRERDPEWPTGDFAGFFMDFKYLLQKTLIYLLGTRNVNHAYFYEPSMLRQVALLIFIVIIFRSMQRLIDVSKARNTKITLRDKHRLK